jgi:hypothetical protein
VEDKYLAHVLSSRITDITLLILTVSSNRFDASTCTWGGFFPGKSLVAISSFGLGS